MMTVGMYKLEELTYRHLDSVDKERTVFFVPVGMLEQHGPHLPIGTDLFISQKFAIDIAKEVQKKKPDWNIILFPSIPVGVHPVDLLSDKFDHVGSFWIRYETLRNLMIDIGISIAKYGFKYIIVMSYHIAPLHLIAIDEASDYVSEKYGIKMWYVNPEEEEVDEKENQILSEHLTESELEDSKVDNHAGTFETLLKSSTFIKSKKNK